MTAPWYQGAVIYVTFSLSSGSICIEVDGKVCIYGKQRGKFPMSVAVVLASSIDGGTIRVVLFIMVLLAVALILTGCVIALLTFYKQIKVPEAR